MWVKFHFIKYSYVSSRSACGFCRRRDCCPQKRLLKKSKVAEICYVSLSYLLQFNLGLYLCHQPTKNLPTTEKSSPGDL